MHANVWVSFSVLLYDHLSTIGIPCDPKMRQTFLVLFLSDVFILGRNKAKMDIETKFPGSLILPHPRPKCFCPIPDTSQTYV